MKVVVAHNGRVHRVIGMTSGNYSYVIDNNFGTYELAVERVVREFEVDRWVNEAMVRKELMKDYPEYFI